MQRLRTHQGYIALVISQALASFNDNMIRAAFVSLFLLDSTHGLMLSSLASIFIVLPSIVLPALASRVSERIGMIATLQWCKGIETTAVLTALLGFFLHHTPTVLIAILILGIQIAISSPSRYSIIPKILPEPAWMQGNGYLEAYGFLGILIGTLIGGSIGFIHHPAWALAGVSALSLIIGILTIRSIPMDTPDTPSQPICLHTPFSIWHDLRRTLSVPQLPPYIWGAAWFWSIGIAILTLLPPVIHDHLHGPKGQLSLLLTTFVLGMGIGSAVSPRVCIRWGLRSTVSCTLAIMAVGMFATGYIHHIEGVCIATACTAIAGGIYSVPLMTEIQERSPMYYRARIIGAMGAICACSMVATVGCISILGHLHIPTHTIVMGIGVLNLLFAFGYYRILPKESTHQP